MTEVTRGEFDMLKSMVQASQGSVTPGVAVVQSQLVELVKDVVELKADVNLRFTAHEKTHDDDQRRRVARRRWTITAVFTGLTVAAAIIGLLVEVLRQVH